MIKNFTKGIIIAASPAVTGSTFAIAHGPFAYHVSPHLKIKAKIGRPIAKALKKVTP